MEAKQAIETLRLTEIWNYVQAEYVCRYNITPSW